MFLKKIIVINLFSERCVLQRNYSNYDCVTKQLQVSITTSLNTWQLHWQFCIFFQPKVRLIICYNRDLFVRCKNKIIDRFTYRIYSKYRKLGIETLCLTKETQRFSIERLDKLVALHCKSRTSTRTSSDGCRKLLPIIDNVSVVIQDALVQHLDSFNKSYS